MSCLVERDYDNLVHILSFSKLREHPTVEATKKIEEATGGEKNISSFRAKNASTRDWDPILSKRVRFKPDGFLFRKA